MKWYHGIDKQHSCRGNNTIIGNSIGITSDGSSADPNGWNGIEIDQVLATSIDDNTISGNTRNGIQITGDTSNGIVVATSTAIDGNLIGTTANGTSALGNGSDGIYVAYSNQNTIGSATTGDQNVISGNKGAGLEISDGGSNIVQNNYIGTDVTGKVALGNAGDGIYLHGGSNNNTIGSVNFMNLISGNAWNGVELYNANSNAIAGNSIGTDATGVMAIGNGQSGVYLSGNASNNTIGALRANPQTDPPSNLISGNGSGQVGPNDAGIDIILVSSQNNLIEGNFIGTNKTGTGAIANFGDGIMFQGAGAGNSIGVANVAGSGNLISGNGHGSTGYGIDSDNTTLASVCFNTIGLDINGNRLINVAGWFDGPAPTVENNNKTQ